MMPHTARFKVAALVSVFLAFFLLTILTVPTTAQAEEAEVSPLDGLYAAAAVDGIEIGYQWGSVSASLRRFFPDDADLDGLRLRHHFWDYAIYGTGNVYWALDLYSVDFEGVITEGDGRMYGLGIGAQHQIHQNMNFTLDMGPHYSSLEDDHSGVDASSTGIVMNMGLEFTF